MMEERIKIESAIYTAIVCLLLIIFMLLYRVTVDVETTLEFSEIIFYQAVEERVERGGGVAGTVEKDASISGGGINLPKIDIPERTTLEGEEIIPYEFAERLDVMGKPGLEYSPGDNRIAEDIPEGRKLISSDIIGRGDKIEASGDGIGPGLGLKLKPGYEIRWDEGVNRVKIEGILPEFPEGVNQEATVKVRVYVLPDGSIERIFPVEKSHPEFERSVFEALQTWRFNPIRENIRQSGVIIFHFRLE